MLAIISRGLNHQKRKIQYVPPHKRKRQLSEKCEKGEAKQEGEGESKEKGRQEKEKK
jgi:hypothetical protein